MFMKKNLHVISSIHCSLGMSSNEFYNLGLDPIIHVNNSLAEIIISNYKITDYFADGNLPDIVDFSNEYIINWKKYETAIKQICQKSYDQEEFQKYFCLKNMISVFNIRKKGIPIRMRATETSPNLFYSMGRCIDMISSSNFKHMKNSKRKFLTDKLYEQSRLRDEIMLDNVLKYGDKHNLIYVGCGHQLKDYEKKVNLYRLNVNFNGWNEKVLISITGKSTKKNMNAIIDFIRKSEYSIEAKLLVDKNKYLIK